MLPALTASGLLGPGTEGLGHDADIGDAGLPQGIDDGSKRAERDGLVTSQKDGVALGIAHLTANLIAELVNVYSVVAEIDQLGAVNGDDQPLVTYLLHRLRFRQIDFDAGLQDRCGDHKDDQQHEHYVYEGDNIDLGKG